MTHPRVRPTDAEFYDRWRGSLETLQEEWSTSLAEPITVDESEVCEIERELMADHPAE